MPSPGAELVTKVYEPTWGRIEPIGFESALVLALYVGMVSVLVWR